MIDQLVKEIANKLQSESEKLQGSSLLPEAKIKSFVESALKKCNLVTREEFEIQEAVLKRSREKIDAMERALREIQEKLDQN